MSASNSKTPNSTMVVSPLYVGMQMHNARTRMAELGSKATARLQDDKGEVASWLIFVVAMAVLAAFLAGAIDTWAQDQVTTITDL